MKSLILSQSIFAILFSLSILGLWIQNRRLSQQVRAYEKQRKHDYNELFEHINNIKLHLRRHEDLFKNLDTERLKPLFESVQTIHSDQANLLVYVSKLFSDANFGTSWHKEKKHK